MAEPDLGGESAGVFHLLDMGSTKYGDCILVRFGETKILIDGGHPGDWKDRQNVRSIPNQLSGLISGPKLHVDLLVVTHCHSDHIGCLPKLVADGSLTARWALVADEKLGFGRDQEDNLDVLDTADPMRRAMIVAALEEDHSDLPDDALEDFLTDAGELEQGYKTMLENLAKNGAKVVRWGRATRAEIEPLLTEFKAANLAILGPSADHLLLCAEQIQASARAASDALDAIERRDVPMTPAQIYRSMVRGSALADPIDRSGSGAAKNCQSIVLAFGPPGHRTLLAADMQFCRPETPGLKPFMKRLMHDVQSYGPYAFVKMTHHTSYNGIDELLLGRLGSPGLLVHSGGSNDARHPDEASLAMLGRLNDSVDVIFARTDRNGLVTVDPSLSGLDAIMISQGQLDDFSPNRANDQEEPIEEAWEQPAPPPAAPEAAAPSDTIELVFVKLPYRPGRVSLGGFEVVIGGDGFEPGVAVQRSARGSMRPPSASAGTKTFDNSGPALAGGRDVSNILFVTDPERLARNIGSREAAAAIELVEAGGARVLKTRSSTARIDTVRHLGSKPADGVVLIGGYDVLPSARVDILDPGLRTAIPAHRITGEADQFIVWSDDEYVDLAGEGMPDLPVSRIPDARRASVLLGALTAPTPPGATRFGVRNSERPFADAIFMTIPGGGEMLKSGPTTSGALSSDMFKNDRHYLMLHGDYADGSRLWGEDEGAIEAIRTANIPARMRGVVFTGACWGALTIDEPACMASIAVSPKAPEQSIAVSYLAAGVTAFIGCTGAHYSPGAEGGFFGGPMHAAFWRELNLGKAPAQALFDSKVRYLHDLPHGRTEPLEIAIERKIYKQFTCLGLGW
ncbi:MAG: hypothetical protein DI565_02615 [Ancylobacter novellus]|uniref:Metallo-beta-lactamase domain-containing protein n=1 Tax=Ancylobacter novellus TaxID=921 RepID=A0A2W5MHH2_ANCNO|nr:MAG: hypothetical protein DI565_02615 [Ancylobacter novellus]